MLVWLGVCAVLAMGAAFPAAMGGVPPAPVFHLVFAVGALPLIVGAIIYFVPVLTRSGRESAAIRRLPLICQVAGLLVAGVLGGVFPAWGLHAAALAIAAVALILTGWIARRSRITLGLPHPGIGWYGAALLCLFFAVSLVPVWQALPALRPALRLFHLHLNTLGFVGLAALGTLPVLFPTVLGKPDPGAAQRLRGDLPVAVTGAILIAAGSAGLPWMAIPGALLLGGVALRNLGAWRRTFGLRSMLADGAALSLVAATVGFAALLVLGVCHGLGWVAARPTLAAFVAGFLLPLVTGALSQLLPVWRHPGPLSARRQVLRGRLAKGGRWRALLFLSGALLLALDHPAGSGLAAGGLLLFLLALLSAFWLDRAGGSDDNQRPIP